MNFLHLHHVTADRLIAFDRRAECYYSAHATDRSALSRRVLRPLPAHRGQFQAALDESLNPRGPEFLYEIVGSLPLPPGASVVDLGCGEGKQSIELAKRFGFAVHGVDPVPRHVELANEALGLNPELSELVR